MSNPRGLIVLLLSLLLIASVAPAAKAQLSFNLQGEPGSISPGGEYVFQGIITNATGETLSGTDLFFDFEGFDQTSLDVEQLLGDVPVSIPDGMTSSDLDLFSVSVLPDALPDQILPLSVTLEDAGGDTSVTQTVSVPVGDQAAADVPEPLSLPLLTVGSVAMLLFARKPRRR